MDLATVLAASVALALASVADAQEWNRFRGPNGQGIAVASDRALPRVFGENNVLWRTPVGGVGHSSPVLWERGLYLTREGAEAGGLALVRFDARTGAEQWASAVEFEPRPRHRLNSAASGTPAADANGVYLVWTSGDGLWAGAFGHDGASRWTTRCGSYQAQHGGASSPIVVAGLLIVANENDGDDCALVALDTESGAERWRVARTSVALRTAYSSPAVFTTGDGVVSVLFAGTAHGLTAVDPANGQIRWEQDLELTERCVATPAIDGEFAIVVAGSNDAGKECAIVRLPGVDGATPEIVHRPRRQLPYVPSALGHGGRFYLVTDGGIASCLDAASGRSIWHQRLDGRFFSSPVSDGETLFVADREGILHSLALGDEFERLGGIDLGAPILATPAIAGGVLYVRTAEQLICLGAPDAFRSGG